MSDETVLRRFVRSSRDLVVRFLRRILPREMKRELKRIWDPNQTITPAEARIAAERRRSRGGGRDAAAKRTPIVCLSIFDWNYRVQRPQHFMMGLADLGHSVFYVSRTQISRGSSYRLRHAAPLIDEVELQLPRALMEAEGGGIDAATIEAAMRALADLRRDQPLGDAIVFVQIPSWAPIALEARRRFGWRIVYDCMDDWSDFPGVAVAVAEEERRLVANADAVIVSSEGLRAKWAPSAKRVEVVRNGVELAHFQSVPSTSLLTDLSGPIAGYIGAIAEWFDTELLAEVARQRPDIQFVLIGRVTVPTGDLAHLPNVHLLGEKQYDVVPAYLRRFDVSLIPFRVNALTAATNPVKLYESFAMGKPVVATALPEVVAAGNLVRIAKDAGEFAEQIDAALNERDEQIREKRVAFAAASDWRRRVSQVAGVVRIAQPRISIVIVTWNNLELTKLCLDSLERNTHYDNLELIVVDNGSTDGTLAALRAGRPENIYMVVIANATNRGFAAANNQGLAIATGDRLVLLNNDTIVPPGWLTRVTRHLDDPAVGLVVPVTNFSGNESRIDVPYKDPSAMESFATRHTNAHEGEVFDIRVAAMYCMAMRRDVFDRVGPLDERFTVGMFEDDDYSHRARLAGYRVICAQDAFVHHFGQASFSKLASDEYRTIFERNRALFEEKWGVSWEPHEARPVGGARNG